MKTKEQLKNSYIMRQKFIKSIIGLLIFFSICSCGGPDTTKRFEENVQHTKESRFFVLYLPNDQESSDFEILVDKETRVEYLFYRAPYRCGLTPLLDKEGNITFYEGEIKKQ